MERIEKGFSSLAGCYALLASLAASFLIYAHLAFLAHPPHWAGPAASFVTESSSGHALNVSRILANIQIAALYFRERMHTTRLFFGVFAAVWLACLLWMDICRRRRKLTFHRREAIWIAGITLLVLSVAVMYGLGTRGNFPKRIRALVPVSDVFAAGFMLTLPLITWSRIRRRHEEQIDAELEDPSELSTRSLARLGLSNDGPIIRPDAPNTGSTETIRPIESFSRPDPTPEVRPDIRPMDLFPTVGTFQSNELVTAAANRLIESIELLVTKPVDVTPPAAPVALLAANSSEPIADASAEPVLMTLAEPIIDAPSEAFTVVSPVRVKAVEHTVSEEPIAAIVTESVDVTPYADIVATSIESQAPEPSEPIAAVFPEPTVTIPAEPLDLPTPEPVGALPAEPVTAEYPVPIALVAESSAESSIDELVEEPISLESEPIALTPPEPDSFTPLEPTPSSLEDVFVAQDMNHATNGVNVHAADGMTGFTHDLSTLNRSWQRIEEMRGQIDDWFEQRRRQAVAHIGTPPAMRNLGLDRNLVQDFPDEKVVAIETEWAEIRSAALEISRLVGDVPPPNRNTERA